MVRPVYKHDEVKAAVVWACEQLLLDRLLTHEDQRSAHRFVIRSLLNEAIWKYSEAGPANEGGKYHRCDQWSVTAWERFQRKKSVKGLIFEHAVPRKEIIDWLISDRFPVTEVLEKVQTCIVTKYEHNNKLLKWNTKKCNDLWHRYAHVERMGAEQRKTYATLANSEPSTSPSIKSVRKNLR